MPNSCAITYVGVGPSWENRDSPRGAGNTLEGLTRSSGTSRKGAEVKPTAQVAVDDRPRDWRGHFKKASISSRVRREVAIRYGATPGTFTRVECHYCEAKGSFYWHLRRDGRPSHWVSLSGLEYDHVIPEYHGGPTEADNIVVACRPCNRRKGVNV